MITKKIFILLLSLIPFLAFAQEKDNGFRIGQLPNGLTYYIRHNSTAKGLADFFIAQKVGSILEQPNERGLAHFLEHMAFNGSEHFRGTSSSPGIVPWCESIGVKFGTNLNAYTSVDQTIYNVSAVPVKRESVVDSVLYILYDWSHALLLSDTEIDKERGVVEEEWRSRQSGMAVQRMMERILPQIYRGTKYEDCLPIGSMEIIRNFPYETLREFYRRWYRPDLQAIIVVGDIDIDAIEAKIKKTFGNISQVKNPVPRLSYSVPFTNKDLVVAVERDSEQPIMLATLYMKHEATSIDEKHRMSYHKKNFCNRLIGVILQEHLEAMQRQAIPPVLNATAHYGRFFVSLGIEAFTLSFGCRQENIKTSFEAAVGVVEQLRFHGVTEGELLRAKASLLSLVEQGLEEEKRPRSRTYVSKAINHFISGEPIYTAQQTFDITKQIAETIDVKELNKWIREVISNQNQTLVIYAPNKKGFDLPPVDTLKQYVFDAQHKSYPIYQEHQVESHGNTNISLPQAGAIISERENPKYGMRELILSNGLRVYVKQTDYKPGQVLFRLWGEGGTQYYPDNDVPNFSFLSSIASSGVASYDTRTLRQILIGKRLKVTPKISTDEQSLRGVSSTNDLEKLFWLAHLYVTQPRKDSLMFLGEIDRMKSFLTNRDANPQVAYNDSLVSILYNNHPRMQTLKREKLSQVDYNRVYSIYKECFSDVSDFRLLLVGDVNLEVLRPMLCKYMANLPSNKSHKARRKIYSQPNIVNKSSTHVFFKPMNTPSAVVSVIYGFNIPHTAKNTLAIEVFKRMLSIAYTERIREELGGTYGVSVSCELDKDSKPTGLLQIKFRTDPKKYEQLIPIVHKQIEQMASGELVNESLNKAKEYLHKIYRQNIRSNDYWDNILYLRLNGEEDYHQHYESDLDNLRLKDIQEIAKRIIKNKNRIEVTMLPQ